MSDDKAESDIANDEKLASGRDTGGIDKSDPNQDSTTSTSETPDYVGRVAGDDMGYEEEQGAERRAEEG